MQKQHCKFEFFFPQCLSESLCSRAMMVSCLDEINSKAVAILPTASAMLLSVLSWRRSRVSFLRWRCSSRRARSSWLVMKLRRRAVRSPACPCCWAKREATEPSWRCRNLRFSGCLVILEAGLGETVGVEVSVLHARLGFSLGDVLHSSGDVTSVGIGEGGVKRPLGSKQGVVTAATDKLCAWCSSDLTAVLAVVANPTRVAEAGSHWLIFAFPNTLSIIWFVKWKK